MKEKEYIYEVVCEGIYLLCSEAVLRCACLVQPAGNKIVTYKLVLNQYDKC